MAIKVKSIAQISSIELEHDDSGNWITERQAAMIRSVRYFDTLGNITRIEDSIRVGDNK